jgi:hypothetical protein
VIEGWRFSVPSTLQSREQLSPAIPLVLSLIVTDIAIEGTEGKKIKTIVFLWKYFAYFTIHMDFYRLR